MVKDTFELPIKVTENEWETVEIKPLSRADAKKVLEGILASYSRNTYLAIEQEILKKKNIDRPLYISLLVQRLNMMDAEELKCLGTEEEIVAHGIEIVRNMPDDLEEAAVAIVRNAIEKITNHTNELYEIIKYMAVSRNGLRMQDIQWVIQNTDLQISMLDVTLLIKYLDSFFCIHKGDRVDFNHKVIRQGLRSIISNRDSYERNIKACIKALEEQDEFKLREGMYYARICRDYELGQALLDVQKFFYTKAAVAKVLDISAGPEETILRNAIKSEAVADSGALLIELIHQKGYDSDLRAMIMNQIIPLFDQTEDELRAKMAILEIIAAYKKEEATEDGDVQSLRGLSITYNKMGNLMLDFDGGEWEYFSIINDIYGE